MKQLLLSLVFAGVCFAQQPCVGGEHPKNAPDCIPAEKYYAGTPFGKIVPDSPVPLKCGKYEHEEHIEGYCHSAACKGNFACPAIAVCDPPIDRCAPDLHTVTEKEWQELMERLKKLEARPEIKFGKPGELTDCSKEPNHCITW